MEKLNELIKESKKLKVLYVEDNEETVKHTQVMLLNFFDDISIAYDGNQGLESFRNNHYDLVLTDINMPKMDGLTLIKHIKKIDKKIDIVIFSAHDDTEYFLEAIRLGIKGYLLKPFDFLKMEEIIGSIVSDKVKNDSDTIKLFGNFHWNKKTSTLYKGINQIRLTKSENLLFNLLLSSNSATYSAVDIESIVFDDEISDTRRVRNLLSRLKRKLDVEIVESIYGEGYRLKIDC